MSTTEPLPEVLIARRIPWRGRLWVRISVMLLVMCGILLTSWWWPRRGMATVWGVGGKIGCDSVIDLHFNFLQWESYWSGGWSWQYSDNIKHLLSSTQTDALVTYATLSESTVDDRWLRHLKQLPNLTFLRLSERQLGPGLEMLREHHQLETVCLGLTSGNRLAELRRLPYLKSLTLVDVPCDGIDFNGLVELTQVYDLALIDCLQTGSVLRELPELPAVSWFFMEACQGLTDDDLRHLQQLPKLTYISIQDSLTAGQVCTLINDEGLSHLAKLKNLERLSLDGSAGQITLSGLASLRNLERLRELTISPCRLSQEQVKTLKEWLPNVSLRLE